MYFRFARQIAIAATLLLAGTLAVHAQAYPHKPIRMIVSIAAGSLTDVIMRAAANELSPRLGQPIVIDNRGHPGCAGMRTGRRRRTHLVRRLSQPALV
jgi:tripartite-type tricarboxylate transporter receptor subunit TctC